MTFAPGTRVRFTTEFWIYPHDIVAEGETGTVVDVGAPDQIALAVTLDENHPDLSDWENEAHFLVDDLDPADYLVAI